jgi:Tetratricopeptide repeat
MARASTQRRRKPRSHAPRKSQPRSSPEDLMFFPKLRRRAKWVFAVIALVFGLGFLVAGVGTGLGSGIGDYISDLFNRQPGVDGPSVENARERLAENPNNAEAQLELARALQADGQTDEAIAAYERYATTRPRDTEALRTLASLYGLKSAEAQQRLDTANAEAQEARLGQDFAPTTPFSQAINQNRISESLASEAEARAQAAQQEVQQYARLQSGIYQRVTLLVDDDPLLWLQFAQAAETAQDYEGAITAYERFLDLSPDHPSAPQVEERIKLLESFAGSSGDQ